MSLNQGSPIVFVIVVFVAPCSRPPHPFYFLLILFIFLDASSHLYMRVCPSVRRSFCPLVGPSIGDAFVKNGKIDDFDRK